MKNKPHFVFIVLLFLFSDSYANQNKDSLKVSPKKHYVGIGIPVLLVSISYISKYQPDETFIQNINSIYRNFQNRSGTNFNLVYGMKVHRKVFIESILRFDYIKSLRIEQFKGISLITTVDYKLNNNIKHTFTTGIGFNYILGNYYINGVKKLNHSILYPVIKFKYSKQINSYSQLSLFSYWGLVYNFFDYKNLNFNTTWFENLNKQQKSYRVSDISGFGGNFDTKFFFTNLIGLSYEISF